MVDKILEKMKWFFKDRTLAEMIMAIVIALLVGVFGALGFTVEEITPASETADAQIVLAEEQPIALIEDTNTGAVVESALPVIESVDAPLANPEQDVEIGGQGWYVPTNTPQAFINATYGQCIDTDGYYGSQCWDLANLFWTNVTDRWLSTCGTGAAKGILNCWEYNAGSEFEMIWDPTQLQAGDIVITTNGTYGHVFMANGPYNNGYIAAYGANQGGGWCPDGGSATNTVNMSLASFGGAFRYKPYIKVAPTPEPIPVSNCVRWHVLRGDTMSKIMMECEGTIQYGAIMDEYAKSWWSLIKNPGSSVYDGWHSEATQGYGLFEDDDIEHRIE